jgi:micrococcal nuclease
MRSTILFGLIGSISVSTSAVASTYKVIKIHDGDTITVVSIQDNSSKKVRLACIDSPEADQPQGKLSTITLNAFVPVGTDIELNEVDTDKYGRTVAEVLKNRINVNQSMVKKGQAVVYHKYLSNCPDGNAYIRAYASKFSSKIPT